MMFARCTATVFTLRSSFAAMSRLDMTRADQLQHLELARRQAVVALAFERRRARRAHAGIEDRLAGRDLPDRGRQIEIQRVLEHVAARAGLERLPDERFLGVHAQHQDGARSTRARESRRVATRPLVPGIAQSITMTAGLSAAASAIASSPLLASPTTSMDGSSLEHPAESRGARGCDRPRAGR